MTKEMKPLLISEMVWLAEVGREPVGFILGVRTSMPPEEDQRPSLHVRSTDRTGKIALLQKPAQNARLVALGVVPKYRRHGVAEMLVLRIIEEGMLKRGYIGECSLILENNIMMNRFLEAIGAEKYKTYRIYRRGLATPK